MLRASRLISVANMTVYPEDGMRFVLEYSLRHTTGPEGENFFALKVDKSHPNGFLIESEDAPLCTGSLDQALLLAERFAAGAVMPCVLQEMVDEWQWQHDMVASVAEAV